MMLFGEPSFYEPFEYPVVTPRRQRREERQYFPVSFFDDFSYSYCPCGCGRAVTSRRPSYLEEDRRPRVKMPQQHMQLRKKRPNSSGRSSAPIQRDLGDKLHSDTKEIPVTFLPQKCEDEISVKRNPCETEGSPQKPEIDQGESHFRVESQRKSNIEQEKEIEVDTCRENMDVVTEEENEFQEPDINVADMKEGCAEKEAEMDSEINDETNLPSEMNTDQTETEDLKEFKDEQMRAIETTLAQLNELKPKVDVFNGLKSDKEYRFLDEMLTRCLLSLDNVESRGMDEIRIARKQAVKEIQCELNKLEDLVIDQSKL